MSIERILDVAVVVPDGSAAKKWYTRTLGMKVVDDDGHWITVSPGGSGTVLHLCEGKPEPGNTGIAFACHGIDETFTALKERGVEFSRAPVDMGWGKHAILKDPWGNEFWLMEE